MLGPVGNIKPGNQNAVKRVGDLKVDGNSKTDNKDAFKWVLTFLHSPVHCELFVLVHIYYSVIKARIEARGFIFGPPIALAIGAKFVPLRKPKKLPGDVIFEEYTLEYGKDRLEMHVGAVELGERALVVDDLIATGGTLCAAMNLLERVGAEVVECACLIELPDLQGRERLNGKPLYVLVEYQ
ncbi:hypothetical protein ACFX11_032550 [Malus domestica]